MKPAEHSWVCVGAQEILSRTGAHEAWCYLFGDHPGDKGYMQRRVDKADLFVIGETYTTRQIVADVFESRSHRRSQAGVA